MNQCLRVVSHLSQNHAVVVSSTQLSVDVYKERKRVTSIHSNTKCQMPNAKRQMPNAKCQTPNAQIPNAQMPNAQYQTPNAKCQMPNATCQMPHAKCTNAKCEMHKCEMHKAKCQWYVPTRSWRLQQTICCRKLELAEPRSRVHTRRTGALGRAM